MIPNIVTGGDTPADMVRMNPALKKRVKILASQKRIIYQPTNSFYQVLSTDAYSIVDHRTNYKAYNLDAVLDGDLQAVIDSDIQADEADRLANQK